MAVPALWVRMKGTVTFIWGDEGSTAMDGGLFSFGGLMRLKVIWAFLYILLGGLACAPADNSLFSKANDTVEKVEIIYGKDDRLESYEVVNPYLKEIADSGVALIKAKRLVLNSKGNFKVLSTNFGRHHKLCQSEPFREQNMAAFCSGFLIAPDKVLTAGHCIQDKIGCSTTRFVFDFKYTSASRKPTILSKDQVYYCDEVLLKSIGQNGDDYAVIKLNKKVKSRKPVMLNSFNDLKPDQQLAVIGHPVGLPQKIADNAFVRDNTHPIFFRANLDTYQGNSGSPVVNVDTGLVEGMLIRGDTDFVDKNGCYISLKCSDHACKGEAVLRAYILKSILNASKIL